TPLKGHAYFLKAIAKIIRSMPYLKVWIVGDAPESKQIYREEVQTLARRLGISHCVQFLGNRKDIPQIISKLNIVVLSTVTEEAFGRVIIEAQACGTPVVATRVGGVVDVVEDGVTGLLVPPKDPDAMAAAILKLLKDKALVEKLTLNARKNVEENFIIEKMSSQTLAAYEEAANIKNILVIKIGAIGDVILAIPSIRALRKKFPEARIYCLVGKEARPILQRCPYLNGIIVFDHKEKDRGIFGLFNILKEVRKYYFDMVIDLQNNRKSHLISYFSMSANRYGYNNRKLSFLLNHKVEPAQVDTPAVEHQFRTLKLLDIDKENLNLELWPSEEDDEYIRILLESEWIGQKEKIVGINLGASKRWLSKCWPLENFAQLCDKLSKDSIRVIVTGTQEDLNSAAKIQKLASSKLLNFAGKTTIMQLAALVKRCSVFVSADSAPLHVAASMGTPMVALFGPTSPERHMPPAKIAVAIKKDVACSPCYKPNCKSMECMRQISVEEVYRTVKSLLNTK
ncbi:MAG: lipopolysaccharide heptosyltransferase II, partial [Candidatus Omnitrophica bacterium]|nr:lipopolysaccharide heptosyltransferase II [Candidatus Omnitrophota bacterium]